MEFENLSNELNKERNQPRTEDNTFTNKNSIEYPSTQDLAKIQVINNNIRLLDEKKADDEMIKQSLNGIAKEHSQYKIETDVNTIKQSLNGIAKEHSQYKIETDVNTIKQSLNNVARESSLKNIENKIIKLEKEIKAIKQNTLPDLISLPNRKVQSKSFSALRGTLIQGINTEILSIKGTGNLIMADFEYDGQSRDITLKIEIDGNIIYHLHFTYLEGLNNTRYFGIINPKLFIPNFYNDSITEPTFQFITQNHTFLRMAKKLMPRSSDAKLSNDLIEINNNDDFHRLKDVYIDEYIPFNTSLKASYLVKNTGSHDELETHIFYNLNN